MSRNSAQDTNYAELERLVLVPPNFAPDEDGAVWVCGFRKEEEPAVMESGGADGGSHEKRSVT